MNILVAHIGARVLAILLFMLGVKMEDFGIMSWFINFGVEFGANIINVG